MSKQGEATFSISRSGPFPLIMTDLLADRRIAAVLSAAAVLLVVLRRVGMTGWQCPVDTAIGQPCPGCGLTRALSALMGGEWQIALQSHPLAPLAAAAIALLAAVSVLPAAGGRKIAATVAMVESRSGIGLLIIVAAIAQWIGRLGGFW